MEAENKLKNKNKFTDTDQVDKKQLVKMTKRYKIPVISKSWGCKVQQGDQNLLYCIAYVEIAQRANPKSYHHKKKNCNSV